jgi:hypothetical protein
MKAIALIDERCSEKIERALKIRGFDVLRARANPSLAPDVASHPDMLAFYDKNTLISSCGYCEKFPYLFSDLRERTDTKFIFAHEPQGKFYPHDCIFNAVRFANYLLCKSDTVSNSVLDYAKSTGLSLCHVRQGYPACTVLRLSDEIAVTSDEGMARALSSVGVTVFKIRTGHITLPTRSYGFIGGTAGIYGGVVYFLGNLDLHPDFEIIKEAINRAGLNYVSLSDDVLFDGGQIFFFGNNPLITTAPSGTNKSPKNPKNEYPK